MELFHVTTEKKAKIYRQTGAILRPVRGFNSLQGAMAWAIKANRTVIYKVSGSPAYKLPDHHNKFGDAYWIDEDIKDFQCVFSAIKDA